jgi:transposase
MVYGAIDLHTKFSQIRIVDAEGHVLTDQRVLTTRERLVGVFSGRGTMRILVEASTESEWVAQTLEAAGHEVIVADPNYGPMYGELRRRVKTDARDAAALAEANRRGWYRAVHRVSREQRRMRQRLGVRRQLVQMRTTVINQIRAILRQDGLRVPSGSAAAMTARLDRGTIAAPLQEVLTPLLELLQALTPLIVRETRTLHTLAAADPIVVQLQSVPGVGPVVALTYRATLDRVDRFPSAGHASSSLGLVPREHSSAERRHRGHITKTGSGEARSMLIQAAWTCWKSRSARTTRFRAWADALAGRRGARIAVVALARRLSRVLYALWRDGTTFEEPSRATAQ